MGDETGESEPIHLELTDALELYGLIVGGTAVQAADQLRDRAGLESALGRPRMYAHYQAADLARKPLFWRTGSPRVRPLSTATSAWRSSRCSHFSP